MQRTNSEKPNLPKRESKHTIFVASLQTPLHRGYQTSLSGPTLRLHFYLHPSIRISFHQQCTLMYLQSENKQVQWWSTTNITMLCSINKQQMKETKVKIEFHIQDYHSPEAGNRKITQISPMQPWSKCKWEKPNNQETEKDTKLNLYYLIVFLVYFSISQNPNRPVLKWNSSHWNYSVTNQMRTWSGSSRWSQDLWAGIDKLSG